MTKYIHVENIMKYSMYCTHFRTEMMSPNGDKHEFEVTRRELVTWGTQKNQRSIGVSALAVIR